MQLRRRIKHTLSFEERLTQEAARLHDAAQKLPLGKQRSDLLKRARQAETAAGINRWLSSGLEQSDLEVRQAINEVLRPMYSEHRRDHDR